MTAFSTTSSQGPLASGTADSGLAASAAASRDIVVGVHPLSVEDVVDVASGRATLSLARDRAFSERLERSRSAFERRLREGARIYGITTGFGDSCATDVGGPGVEDLARNLVRFHGCGTGPLLTSEEARATMVARLASLAAGYSAVRRAVLEQLAAFLAAGISPEIPARGSVGASGDLTPLSYVAAALIGERRVRLHGISMPAAEALERAGIAPLALEPKESLALMNGTSVMTGLGCLAFVRAARLARLSTALTAMAVDACAGEPRHFDDRIFLAKPHPGQRTVARWLREDLAYAERSFAEPARVQDRYSLRCAPHVIGVLVDSLPFVRRLVEIELNGASDNPLVDPETGDLLHGGNFYGGHVAHAMDLLKTAVASVLDLMDRQLVLLCNSATNGGLPENLVGATPNERAAHHGFKAMQILLSALAAEALKLTMPASAFSRSTENHNQDKVSMGTIAARDALLVLDLAETGASVLLLALAQAVDLRGLAACHGRSLVLRAAVRRLVPENRGDRAMDADIELVLSELRARRLDFGSVEGVEG